MKPSQSLTINDHGQKSRSASSPIFSIPHQHRSSHLMSKFLISVVVLGDGQKPSPGINHDNQAQ